MKYYYDLHIHTCLSPCGENEMTPCSIAMYADMVGLDIIAISDHNSSGNVESVVRTAKNNGSNLLVVPGLELTTAEDIHILLLFPSTQAANAASEEVRTRQMKVKNKPHIFGDQLYMDENDEELGTEEKLLIVATSISSEEASSFAKKFGGVAIPAHIDKQSNSMLAILGAVDDSSGFCTVEMTERAEQKLLDEYKKRGYNIISDSDSHMLGVMNEKSDKNAIELDELTIECLIKKLSQKNTTN